LVPGWRTTWKVPGFDFAMDGLQIVDGASKDYLVTCRCCGDQFLLSVKLHIRPGRWLGYKFCKAFAFPVDKIEPYWEAVSQIGSYTHFGNVPEWTGDWKLERRGHVTILNPEQTKIEDAVYDAQRLGKMLQHLSPPMRDLVMLGWERNSCTTAGALKQKSDGFYRVLQVVERYPNCGSDAIMEHVKKDRYNYLMMQQVLKKWELKRLCHIDYQFGFLHDVEKLSLDELGQEVLNRYRSLSCDPDILEHLPWERYKVKKDYPDDLTRIPADLDNDACKSLRVLLNAFDALAVGNRVYQFTGKRRFISRLPLLERVVP